ncbi:DUF559 domain-containing protein [Sphingomonas sp.]|uniref:DUF559 domain-containing protein n=1 Tax=Sphingomonas sp. TaxID=28214 RepID=UPI0035C79165
MHPTRADCLRTLHPRFTRQLVIGHYIADFACRSLKLIVELDGSQHATLVTNAERTCYLETQGWTVLRFWNNDVLANSDGVMSAILEAAARASTHPRPLPCREGSLSRATRAGSN